MLLRMPTAPTDTALAVLVAVADMLCAVEACADMPPTKSANELVLNEPFMSAEGPEKKLSNAPLASPCALNEPLVPASPWAHCDEESEPKKLSMADMYMWSSNVADAYEPMFVCVST